jgi:hypothetical protein
MTAEETTERTAQIISVALDAPLVNQAGTPYVGCQVYYKGPDGKPYNKCMHNNTFKYNKPLLEDLKALKAGDYVAIVSQKVGNFVNWVSVKKTEAPAQQATETPNETTKAAMQEAVATRTTVTSGAQPAPTRTEVKSNYETPAERAARQVMIVRQSSITAALKLAELNIQTGNGFAPTEDQVIESAKVFEAFVLGTSNEPKMPE